MPTLFTSIPKCGKNLITALFDALRLQRIESPSVVEASSHIMVRWSIHARRAGRQVQPAFPDDALDDYAVQTRGGLDALIEDIKRMPADAYIHGHLPFHPDLHRAAVEAGVSIVFVYRDPRAMVASQAAYLLDKGIPEDYLPRLSSRDMPGALRLLIWGDGQTLPVAEIFESYRGWLSAEGVLAVRFEDLVGPLGDGSAATQLATVARIAEHVGCARSPIDVAKLAIRVYNPRSGTFRRGTIDGWLQDVPAELMAEEPGLFDDLARAWGYRVARQGAPASPERDALVALLRAALDDSARWQRHVQEREADAAERLALLHQITARLGEVTAERDRLAAEARPL